MKRRDFMKMMCLAFFYPKGLLKAGAGTGSVATSGFEQTYFKNKIYAVPKSEKIYLDYYNIKQTTQKPLLRIFNWENSTLKYVYLPLDEIRYSDKPLPRFYVEFESIQPLEKCDLIIIENRWETRHKEYIVVESTPIMEVFDVKNEKDKA